MSRAILNQKLKDFLAVMSVTVLTGCSGSVLDPGADRFVPAKCGKSLAISAPECAALQVEAAEDSSRKVIKVPLDIP